jgi:uncharacterized membrane protein YjdF
MNVNRPYTVELARQLLAAYDHDVLTDRHHDDIAVHYANAEPDGVDRATLDRATHILQRLTPADVDEWIRQEYIVDGWLHGYLALTVDSADPSLTTWQLGQLASAHHPDAS